MQKMVNQLGGSTDSQELRNQLWVQKKTSCKKFVSFREPQKNVFLSNEKTNNFSFLTFLNLKSFFNNYRNILSGTRSNTTLSNWQKTPTSISEIWQHWRVPRHPVAPENCVRERCKKSDYRMNLRARSTVSRYKEKDEFFLSLKNGTKNCRLAEFLKIQWNNLW